MAKELLHDVTNNDPSTFTKMNTTVRKSEETARITCEKDEEQEVTEELVDTDNHQADININNPLLGVTEPRNSVTVTIHGVTNLKAMDHSYSRHLEEPMSAQPDYYATTEDEEDAIDGLLRLSAMDTSLIEFPGDNGQLMPTALKVSETGDMLLDTVEVTAAIENIALEETTEKTTST